MCVFCLPEERLEEGGQTYTASELDPMAYYIDGMYPMKKDDKGGGGFCGCCCGWWKEPVLCAGGVGLD